MTTTTTDLTALSPAEVDEAWAEAMAPANALHARLAETRRSIRRYEKAGGYSVPEYLTERAAKLEAELDEAMKASAPFDAEYERRGGWARYIIVTSSSNGHVHRGRGYCGSLIPGKTPVAPVFEFSGQDDEGVVVAAGYTACSKCFPAAPVASADDKRAEAIANGRCPGAGEQATAFSANRRYGKCPTCKGTFGVSTYGKVRPHKAA